MILLFRVMDLGIIDFNRNRFSEFGKIRGGTKKFKGARGELNMFGRIKYDDAGFPAGLVGSITGKICNASATHPDVSD